jgi:hypothetical protein
MGCTAPYVYSTKFSKELCKQDVKLYNVYVPVELVMAAG